ncbi:MAG TPA: hypothetical protein H9705_04240, partial [Candidatus Fusicatenibacter intestinigallinarum]|nr:hypothetical protein [Candidatus Fusicatenibacter intestinigallinarum]
MVVIWYEVMNYVEYWEWTDDVPLSFRMGKKDNDREINEWYNSLGKYQIQSRQKEQFYTKDKTALNVILSNCTRPRTVSWET